MLCASSSEYLHRLLTSLFLFQLPNPLLQELPLWLLLGQRQSFLIRGARSRLGQTCLTTVLFTGVSFHTLRFGSCFNEKNAD
jgi:hypothetical protein